METDSLLYFLGLPLENKILFLGIFMVVLRSIIYYRMQNNNNEIHNVEENSENKTNSTDINQSPLEESDQTTFQNGFRGRKRGSRGGRRGQGKRFQDQTPHGTTSPLMQTEDQTLKLILSRRSIFPKQFIEGGEVSDQDLEMIMEAANWAPTHARHNGLKTENYNTLFPHTELGL